MTIDEIIDDIVEGSSGTYSISWSEEFEALSDSDKEIVKKGVYEEIQECDGCGWSWNVNELEDTSAGVLCWQCQQNLDEGDDDAL